VRSLLQSLSIFRMREMEDARSLAGLAMEVYSDRISVDQDEQERLRFSPDDIVKLPIHRAINLWIAQGVPRGGFLAATLPMEHLYRQELAADHAHAQRQRGGHHPGPLGDPLVDMSTPTGQREQRRRTVADTPRRNGDESGEGNGSMATRPRKGWQLTFGDVGSEARRDDL
jgi:hypothetical protein